MVLCAGGAGAFIDQMASLLNTDSSGLNELAKNYKMLYQLHLVVEFLLKQIFNLFLNEGAKKKIFLHLFSGSC